MFVPNHLHLIVKGYIKNPPREVESMNKWLIELVEKVRMKVVAGPTSVYVDEPGNEGITGTVTLATSHAAIHVWDALELPMFQFDIYSCTHFSPDEVMEHFKEFDLVSYEYVFLDRNDGISILDKKKIN